jgi:hypothetical protein
VALRPRLSPGVPLSMNWFRSYARDRYMGRQGRAAEHVQGAKLMIQRSEVRIPQMGLLQRLNAEDVQELNTEFDAWAAKRDYELDSFRPGKDRVSLAYRSLVSLAQNEYDTFYRSPSYSVHGSLALKSLIMTAQHGVPVRCQRHASALVPGIGT